MAHHPGPVHWERQLVTDSKTQQDRYSVGDTALKSLELHLGFEYFLLKKSSLNII